MKRLSISLFLGTLMSFIAVIGAFAADITNAIYKADIVVTNNGTATNNQSAVFTLNTSQLINQNFVNAALNNTAIINNAGGDNPFMPGAEDDQPWVVWVSSIGGAITNSPYVLYLGGNQSMNSSIVYFPGAEGMNTTDNASMELGANFTINQTAFIDTTAGANKYLINKPGVITANISNGNITVRIIGSGNISSQLIPTSYNQSGSGIAWTNLQNAADGNTSTTTLGSTSDNIFQYLQYSGNFSQNATHLWWHTTATGTTNIGNIDLFYDGVWNSLLSSGSVPTGNVWTSYAIGGSYNVTAVRLRLSVTGAGTISINEVRFSDPGTNLTASNIAYGLQPVSIRLTSNNLSLLVNEVVQNSTIVSSNFTVENSANNWQFFTANATLYVQRHQITINGTLQQDISWQYNSGTPYVFTDASGNGHSAVPTFRTAGTSVNVTANMTTFEPLEQTTSTVTNPSIASYNLTSNFTQPANLYTELNITFPGAAVLNELLDGASIPRAIVWFPLIFGFINLAGLGMYALTKSVMVEALVVGFLIMLASLMGGFGYWVVIEYIILALAIILADKQYGW